MPKNLNWTYFAAFCLSLLSVVPSLAQNDSFSSGGDSFSWGGDSFCSAGTTQDEARLPKLRLNFAMHVSEPEQMEMVKDYGLRDKTSALNELEGTSTGDEFSGYERDYIAAVERYLQNGWHGVAQEITRATTDVFDSGYGLPRKGVMTYFDNGARGALLVGHSFPVEQQWALYFAGKTKNPPFKPQFPDEVRLVSWVAGDSDYYGDAFSSGAANDEPAYQAAGLRRHARGGKREARQGSGHPSASQSSIANGQSAIAGVLAEPHWANSSPLRVYISGVVSSARAGLVSHEIKSALRQWREASNDKIRYVLTDRYVDADILFVCGRTLDNEWAENVISYHNSMYDRVHVNLLEETLYKLDPKRVRAVCLHEVGHAFGIRDHSRDSKDAMSLAATDDFHPILALTNNDKKLIAKLYP